MYVNSGNAGNRQYKNGSVCVFYLLGIPCIETLTLYTHIIHQAYPHIPNKIRFIHIQLIYFQLQMEHHLTSHTKRTQTHLCIPCKIEFKNSIKYRAHVAEHSRVSCILIVLYGKLTVFVRFTGTIGP